MVRTAAGSHVRRGEKSADDAVKVTFISSDPSLAELYRLKLELDGYWVTLAATLAEGLQRIHDQPPDLVFLDLGLGNQGRLDALGTLRRDPALKKLPIILLLRGGDGIRTVSGLQLGSSDYLVRAESVASQDVAAHHAAAGLAS
ncbi:MAG TPA: response regulator [Bryobacteraceae bacterium]|jgi:DNA-binding response OmpR family regulator|nr:response regulator [Bryobacteraceae bacterium]